MAIEDRTDSKLEEQGRTSILALEHAARERAEAADHLKDEFVATVSHELRGPLTVIAGWINILAGSKGHLDEATLTRALAAIDRGVKTQGRLIADLLDHARILSGKVKLSRAPIDLLTVAEAAIEGVRAAAEAKDITIELSGEHAASIVLGDFDRMQQVLWNLFFNAVKFTPRGGRVTIWTGRVETHVHLTVTDTGQGIAAAFLPHVFERFRQAEGSASHTQAGLGLGLTLVRELVELHGGTVKAESAGEGRGATFTVALPIPALLLEPLAGIDRAAEGGGARTGPTRNDGRLEGLSVLVVDDDADVRDALAGVLERCGATVRAAAGTGEAMTAVREAVPDVLVSDLGMPGEDGYELIRQVRLLPPGAGGDASRARRQRLCPGERPAQGARRRLPRPPGQAGGGGRAGARSGPGGGPRPRQLRRRDSASQPRFQNAPASQGRETKGFRPFLARPRGTPVATHLPAASFRPPKSHADRRDSRLLQP